MLRHVLFAIGLCGCVTLIPATTAHTEERKVIQLPPIKINVSSVPGCDPKGKFPQMVLMPQLSQGSQIQHDCDLYDRDEVAWVVAFFYQEWEKAYGDPNKKVWNAMQNIMIEWGVEQRFVARAYDSKGRLVKDVEAFGLALAPTIIWVKAHSHWISETSLVHELVHVALWAQNGTPDPDHEGHQVRGWTPQHTDFITSVNRKLAMLNH